MLIGAYCSILRRISMHLKMVWLDVTHELTCVKAFVNKMFVLTKRWHRQEES